MPKLTRYLPLIGLLLTCGRVDPLKNPALGGELTEFQVITDIPGYSIYRPVSVCVDSPYIFVADEGLCTVVVLDWELNWIRNIGRLGEGPGEFTRLKDITCRAGILAALDAGNYRVSIFTYEGEFIGSFRKRAHGGYPEIAFTPAGTIWIGQHRQTANTRAFFGQAPGPPDTFLTEYSIKGEVLTISSWNPEVLRTRSEAEMILHADPMGLLMAFLHTPRLTRLGIDSFDRFYDIDTGFPIISITWQRVIKRRLDPTSRSGSLIAIFGGFGRHNGQLILAGPLYNLAVVELDSGRLHPVSLGQFGIDLVWEGNHATWNDLAILDDRILLISSMTGKIVVVSLSDVLEAAKEGVVLEPLPNRPTGY